jgi:two-component system sensor histidine kinase/response regulator
VSGGPQDVDAGHGDPVILAVDDREENLVAMRIALSGVDGELITATSGQQAIEIALSRSDIAVILLDVQMPGMDGFETAQTLRLSESTKATPIIFVTANSTHAEHAFQGYACGAVDYLPKPITKHVLQSKVLVFLELARQRNALLQVTRDLEASRLELERSNAALQDFAHAAAHDLKAPVRHIRAWSEMLQRKHGVELSQGALDVLGRIDTSASTMQELIGGLLNYAQLDAADLEASSVALNGLLAEVGSELKHDLEAKAGSLEVASLPQVVGDATLLRQLFVNLLGNSIKYSRPEVAPEIQVRCDVQPEAGCCEIAVVDNGRGFEPERAEWIFEPFRRLVGSEIEGSGIGMASARKIVELHGGRICATGEPGRGATFTLSLPLSPDQTQSRPQAGLAPADVRPVPRDLS